MPTDRGQVMSTPPLGDNPMTGLASIKAISGTSLVTEGISVKKWAITQAGPFKGLPRATDSWNTKDGTYTGRYAESSNVLFGDGHVKSVGSPRTRCGPENRTSRWSRADAKSIVR